MNKSILGLAVGIALAVMATGSASAQSLEGGYLGLNGGYLNGNVAPVGGGDVAIQGLTGGVFAGYGVTHNGIYAGVEADVGVSDAKGAGFARHERVGTSIRLGYTVSEDALIYASGGLAWSKYAADGDTDWVQSYTVGGGMEQTLTENVFARVSYEFDLSKDGGKTIGAKAIEPVAQTAKFGIGMKF